MPISSTTIASIGDLGYSVDALRSDQHFFAAPGSASPLDRMPTLGVGAHGPFTLDKEVPIWDGKTGKRIR